MTKQKSGGKRGLGLADLNLAEKRREPPPPPKKPVENVDEPKDPFAYRKKQACVWLPRGVQAEALIFARNQRKTVGKYVEDLIRADLRRHGIHVPEGEDHD